MSKPQKRKTPSSPQTAKPSKQFKANMVTLNAYSSTRALNDTLMKTVAHRYETRDITNKKTALTLMNFLENNEMEKFGKKWATVDIQASKKTAKVTAKRETKYQAEKEEMDKVIRGVERVVLKPKLKTKDRGTEAPTYEVEFLKDYRNFEEAWEAGVKKLIKMTEEHMKTKPNIKFSLGATYQIKKMEIDPNNDNPDTVEEVEVETIKRDIKIKSVQLYNTATVKPTLKGLKSQMEHAFQKDFNKAKGSS